MRYPRAAGLIGILLLLTAGGCDLVGAGGNKDNEDREVKAFAESQALPDAQAPVFFLRLPEQDLKVFRVPFGPPRDCPSGCFYSQLFGLKYGDRIGWIAPVDTLLEEAGSLNRRLRFFDVRPTDDYLFSQALSDRFKKKGPYGEQIFFAFQELLARDRDTPVNILREFAELAYDGSHWALLTTLIENPTAQTTRSILQVLAGLPVDAPSHTYGQVRYERVRDQARRLLSQLDE